MKNHTFVRLVEWREQCIIRTSANQSMKTIASLLISALTILTVSSATAQVTYTGTGHADGTTADGDGISSVVVNNDANNITFTINSTANQAAYMFYAVDIQTIGQAGSGYTGFNNPIFSSGGPALGISTGENAVLDEMGGTFSAYTYAGTWTENASGSVAAGGTGDTFATITVPLNSLGLSPGDSFYFDTESTYTSWANGGPQSAYGALDSAGGYPAESNGSYQPYNNNNYYDSATDAAGTTFGTVASLYTVASVPEPTTCGLIGLGALAMAGRMMRRKA